MRIMCLFIHLFAGEDAVSLESGDEANFQKLYELGKEELKKQVSSNSTLEARVSELNRYWFLFLSFPMFIRKLVSNY